MKQDKTCSILKKLCLFKKHLGDTCTAVAYNTHRQFLLWVNTGS